MYKYPVVILHGWNLSSFRFTPLIEEFKSRGFKVYAPDLPGFGSSIKPDKPLFLSDYVSFVEQYLKKNKIINPIIIGHSFGGRVALKLAYKNPKLLGSLVLTGTPGVTPISSGKILFFILLAKIGNKFFSLPMFSHFQQRARILIYRLARASDFYNTNIKLRQTFKNIVREDLVFYMKNINLPVLLLWGQEDRVVPVEVAIKMKEYIKNSKIKIIPNARHGLPWTHSQKFVREVELFLQSYTTKTQVYT